MALDVNSYGGHPAQAEIIGSRIRHFASKHNLPLYGFVSDRALSAGYAILSVADRIYVDRTSLLGNIGVVWKLVDLSGLVDRAGASVYSLESQK